MLASPDSAGGGLGPCSRRAPTRRADFVFLKNNCSKLKCLFVRIDTDQSESEHTRPRVVHQEVLFPCAFQVDVSNHGKPLRFMISCVTFYSHFAFNGTMYSCGFRTEYVALGPAFLLSPVSCSGSASAGYKISVFSIFAEISKKRFSSYFG